MARFGFVGGFYTSQSVLADCQTCMNLYPEAIESASAKSQMALYCTPGLTAFCQTQKPVRGIFQINGRCFAVGAGTLYEIMANGTATPVGQAPVPMPVPVPPGSPPAPGVPVIGGTFYPAAPIGQVGNDFLPVTMATNGTAGNQLAICSAGSVYIFYLKATGNYLAGTLFEVGGIQGQASQIVFCDGYFVVTLRNPDGSGTNKFQVSALEDGTTWNALSVQQISVFPENIGAMVAVFRQLWLFGVNGHTQVYYNSGASAFTPFDVIQGAYMEEGINAPLSLCVLDNAPFWIGGNQNGSGMAWRANGYAPLRVSNFAIETVWASYPMKCSDAVGYSYRDQGHTFWVLRFPSANNGFGATWVYDVASGMWHERGFLSGNGYNGFSAHLSQCHAFVFNKHLVGDWNSGTVYAMSREALTDNGTPIRRLRRAPHVSSEDLRIFHQQMQLAVEVGDALEPPLLDGAGNPRAPQVMLRWSNDGGKTWSNEHWASAGSAGEYLDRVFWNRLGYARDRVYEVSMTDPIPWRIIDAYLRATPGYNTPTERYAAQVAKEA